MQAAGTGIAALHIRRVDLVEIYFDDIARGLQDSSNSEFRMLKEIKYIFSGESVDQKTHELGQVRLLFNSN